MIYNNLFDWQKDIINKFEERKSFGLFLDMGLGKTPLALSFAERHNSNKILIVSINKKALEDENVEGSFFWWIKKMDKDFNLYNKTYNFRNEGPKKRRVTLSENGQDVLLINYEGLFKHATGERKIELSDIVSDFIKSCRNQNVTIILDESHNVKDLDSTKTKAIIKIKRNLLIAGADLHIYLLSGTPFTQGFIDLYSQLSLLGWEGNKTLFKDSFCVIDNLPGLMGWQQPIIGYKNVDKLYELVHRFAITIKSSNVIKLPEQVFKYYKIDNFLEMDLMTFPTYKKESIEQYVQKNNIRLPYKLNNSPRGGKINNPFYGNINFPDLTWEADMAGTFWMRCRQLSIGFQGNSEKDKWFNKTRLQAFKKLLENNPDNYVVFYNYMAEFLELFNICHELGYKVDVYNGELKSLYFYEKYENQKEGDRLVNTKNVILTHFKSGSTGGNWQLYNKCVLFSIPLFGEWAQAIKRVHRIGQKETVIYYIFYTDNWLDNSMLKALKESKEYDKHLFETDLQRIQKLINKE